MRISQNWLQGKGPVSTGLFYGDDHWRPVNFDSEENVLKIDSISDLPPEVDFAEYADYENGRLSFPTGILRWGGGPWEGEGWIALEDLSSNLIWLFHFNESEAFTQARLNNGKLEVVAYEYPRSTILIIPQASPHLATLKCQYENI